MNRYVIRHYLSFALMKQIFETNAICAFANLRANQREFNSSPLGKHNQDYGEVGRLTNDSWGHSAHIPVKGALCGGINA
ncbi:hypothetical protein CEXT_597301 [Caerostris extrusa]|uniref:Uncharacterized protein n=1 Tax=Caerostris extrusa TaxID=172846 RepID=A0AAV4Q8M3_CAEEX|nr:hypothetical protein CEXT_597301 [Caerostris extrusa]